MQAFRVANNPSQTLGYVAHAGLTPHPLEYRSTNHGSDPPRDGETPSLLALDAIVNVGDGHPGTPLGAADICTALFTRHLKFDPSCPRWPDRDRFVQSNGHGSTLIYALLHLTGYAAFPIEQVKRFRELGSNTPGHPEYEPDHGVEITTGPLGQGIANAAGMAVAEAMLNDEFGDEIVRPLDLRAGRRRLPDGGPRPRGDLPRRAPAPAAS